MVWRLMAKKEAVDEIYAPVKGRDSYIRRRLFRAQRDQSFLYPPTTPARSRPQEPASTLHPLSRIADPPSSNTHDTPAHKPREKAGRSIPSCRMLCPVVIRRTIHTDDGTSAVHTCRSMVRFRTSRARLESWLLDAHCLLGVRWGGVAGDRDMGGGL